jgi:hypothetical protein
MTDNQPPQPDVLTWQQHMEALVIGAVRWRAEAHAALERATGGALPPLNDLTMFRAAEIMTAMLLEASIECEAPRSFPSASRQVGRDVLAHMRVFRTKHDKDGAPTLVRIIEQAGLERQRPH